MLMDSMVTELEPARKCINWHIASLALSQ